jgi:hypothetical protein
MPAENKKQRNAKKRNRNSRGNRFYDEHQSRPKSRPIKKPEAPAAPVNPFDALAQLGDDRMDFMKDQGVFGGIRNSQRNYGESDNNPFGDGTPGSSYFTTPEERKRNIASRQGNFVDPAEQRQNAILAVAQRKLMQSSKPPAQRQQYTPSSSSVGGLNAIYDPVTGQSRDGLYRQDPQATGFQNPFERNLPYEQQMGERNLDQLSSVEGDVYTPEQRESAKQRMDFIAQTPGLGNYNPAPPAWNPKTNQYDFGQGSYPTPAPEPNFELAPGDYVGKQEGPPPTPPPTPPAPAPAPVTNSTPIVESYDSKFSGVPTATSEQPTKVPNPFDLTSDLGIDGVIPNVQSRADLSLNLLRDILGQVLSGEMGGHTAEAVRRLREKQLQQQF